LLLYFKVRKQGLRENTKNHILNQFTSKLFVLKIDVFQLAVEGMAGMNLAGLDQGSETLIRPSVFIH
jgi:hypothetical protein